VDLAAGQAQCAAAKLPALTESEDPSPLLFQVYRYIYICCGNVFFQGLESDRVYATMAAFMLPRAV